MGSPYLIADRQTTRRQIRRESLLYPPTGQVSKALPAVMDGGSDFQQTLIGDFLLRDDRLVRIYKTDVEKLRGFKAHPPHTSLDVRGVYMLVLLFSRVIEG